MNIRNRFFTIRRTAAISCLLLLLGLTLRPADVVTVGVIGLDTSHSTAFTRLLHELEGSTYRVTVAYPYGSRTIESSYQRIPGYVEEMREMGVEIVDSIEELLRRVDVVLLETNDGNPRLEQALQVIRAGKPMFVDKPVAASLPDVIAVYVAAERAGVPIFSSSSLRYMPNLQAVRAGSAGAVLGATAYSPAHIEPSHPDLFWYGIHGVETLFTAMGTGCETVVRTHTEAADVVTCRWADGRLGTFHGMRDGRGGYGGTAFGTDGIAELGPYEGYGPLVGEIARFFETGESPVPVEETLEIYAFMAAADVSKAEGGRPVQMADVMADARSRALEILARSP